MEILSDKELMRYNRQIVIPAFDIDGQEALKQARVLVIGVGGLGCGAAQYLAAAGIGHLTLVDFDEVESHNLQRQILHTDARVGMNKAESAKSAIAELNPYVEVSVITECLEDDALAAQVADHGLVLDCTDNLDTRNQLNRICFAAKVPLVSGAAIRMEGLVTVLNYADDQPCYHCFSAMFGDQQLTCVESGILSPVVGLVSSIQATEAIKQIAGMGKPLHGRMLMVDAMTMQFREMRVPKMPGCSVCG
ncbi:molybdopterin-synthase adenylyltransferase MoeB [Ferrimonas sediminicola]|uniref:Molybdopterin-synthase adenylyltransferase n=1 Tax=Ferrimonas sediminicola TaxID=2569538 RepID=A0A4U1BIA3_9GAMM|nr:molybdopterin-synthase adenylyltransferase MoeB [Ferrimonas sediminicola]TKB51059.1 molybdopterin-synthase adenylyltransferase MoeB [Ferrimonas sediminicola]